ncbi:MAG: hypothetical protein F4060_08950 [Holophagales bacterium]|nr:hypothetical protein [Holophagales bacterium]MYG29424.1 hypothetical protein [Holophagales bacterium]MYI80058.1 hypothetical protein [Holophagales bacterium]
MTQELVLADIADSRFYSDGKDGPVVEVHQRRMEGPVRLVKVTERKHCPRTTGQVFLSDASLFRQDPEGDQHDSTHPSKHLRVRVKFPDGWRDLEGVQETAWQYSPGFIYCMTMERDVEPSVDLGVFGSKKDPVASRLLLDVMDFAAMVGHSLAVELGLERVTVVHGKVRYFDYEGRDSELHRTHVLQSHGGASPSVEATFIKGRAFRPENEYRFVFLCDRKGFEGAVLPVGHYARGGEPITVWEAL